ncbi:hypothetical protein DFQ28_005194 [Apophysomyces sp. BC1034]|nr:hypothetical protein DFQ30_005081 [Apophysomyces sp. BC1015]KAG0177997.1 hypothetical protein DFQ29_004089 [Apophysomyces sp. BC1021]KAG0188236.1 hypothetical protein DFQ28_005194 [Apophysomyces sp. BC1034]
MSPQFLHPKPSSSSTNKPSAPGIKLAPLIQKASIISFEKRADQKIWYIVKIYPQQMNLGLPVVRRPYLIARRYDDFVHFAQRIHESTHRAGSRLDLPKIKGRLNILPNKHIHVQRRAELDRFIQAFFVLSPSITKSLIAQEFFGLQKADTEQQVLRDNHDNITTRQAPSRLIRSRSHVETVQSAPPQPTIQKSASQPNLVEPFLVFRDKDMPVHPLSPRPYGAAEFKSYQDQPSRWKRLPSIRERSAPVPTPSTSITSFCAQAASKIIPWTSKQQQIPPSPLMVDIATAAMPLLSNSTLPSPSSTSSTSSTSSAGSYISRATAATSVSPSPTVSPTLRKIKIKVIYDVDNIIVIQVPRSISLEELRSRISHKFSDPSMGALRLEKEFVLLFNDARSSSSTNSSSPVTLIGKEQDLSRAMNTKWSRLEKVTLRCIV